MFINESTSSVTIHLSIIVPLYNEEESVEMLLSELLEICKEFEFPYEIIFVDDGSTDSTWEIIEGLKEKVSPLKAIRFRRNYGQTSAMVAGFDHASGEIIVCMDGDLQNDPSDIPRLLTKIEEGYDIVSGWRKDRKDSFLRVFISRIANVIISFTTGVHLHDYGCSLKAYRTECIKPLRAYGDMHRFFPALATMTGARITQIPVKHSSRQYGISKYGFDRIFKVFSDIFAINMITRFSSNPLKAYVISALPFLFLTMFFMGLGVSAIIFQWTSGKGLFFIVASALSAMAVVHLVVLGVVAELVVSTSDLSHTELPEITKKCIVNKGDDLPVEMSGEQNRNCKFNRCKNIPSREQ